MQAFELSPVNEFAPARPLALTRTLFVPDLDGNWRELRIHGRATPAVRDAGRSAGAPPLLGRPHAA